MTAADNRQRKKQKKRDSKGNKEVGCTVELMAKKSRKDINIEGLNENGEV